MLLCDGRRPAARDLDEVRRGAFDLRADAPTRDEHRLLRKAALIVDGHELLFHAHRAAAAPDIAGDFVDVGNVGKCPRSDCGKW